MSMKNSNDTIGNRTRDLPTCSAVPQPAALPRAPVCYVTTHFVWVLIECELIWRTSDSLYKFLCVVVNNCSLWLPTHGCHVCQPSDQFLNYKLSGRLIGVTRRAWGTTTISRTAPVVMKQPVRAPESTNKHKIWGRTAKYSGEWMAVHA